MAGRLVAELQRFLERLRRAEDEALTIGRDLVILRQSMRDAWSERGGIRVCLTTITGTVRGCSSLLVSGASIRVVGHSTGTAYGTATTDGSGAFSFTAELSNSDTSINLYVTGPGSRFQESTAQNVSFTRCGTASVGTRTTTPVTGAYACHPTCALPLAWTLSVDDPVFGARTITVGVGSLGSGWVTTFTPDVSYQYPIDPLQNGRLHIFPGDGTGYVASFTSRTCPTADGATKFEAIFPAPTGGTSPYSPGQTIRIYEP